MNLHGKHCQGESLGKDKSCDDRITLFGAEFVPAARQEAEEEIKTRDGHGTDQEAAVENRDKSLEWFQTKNDVINKTEQDNQPDQIGSATQHGEVQPESDPSQSNHFCRQSRHDPALLQGDKSRYDRHYHGNSCIGRDGQARQRGTTPHQFGQADLAPREEQGEDLDRPGRFPMVLGEKSQQEKGRRPEDYDLLDLRRFISGMKAGNNYMMVPQKRFTV